MGKSLCAVLLLLSLCGCSAIYVDPGQTPATLRVHALATLDPAWVDDMLQYRLLSVEEYLKAKWNGSLEGPWWAIKAYQRGADGQLTPLRPLIGGLFAGVTTYNFSGSRDFIIPMGNYQVEIWLTAYMYYCSGFSWDTCATPTLRIWKEGLDINQFASGQLYEAYVGQQLGGKD